MPNKILSFEKGVVTSKDPSSLENGELQHAEGCEYREGSPHIYKQPGRKAIASRTFSDVKAIQRFQYNDVEEDILVAVSGGQIYETDVFTKAGEAGRLDAVLGGLDKDAVPSFAAMRDTWVMVTGEDALVREVYPEDTASELDQASLDQVGKWRSLGMQPPTGQLSRGTDPGVTFEEVSKSTDYSNNVASGGTGDGFANPTKAYDGNSGSYALMEVSGDNDSGTAQTKAKKQRHNFTISASSNIAQTNRILQFRWAAEHRDWRIIREISCTIFAITNGVTSQVEKFFINESDNSYTSQSSEINYVNPRWVIYNIPDSVVLGDGVGADTKYRLQFALHYDRDDPHAHDNDFARVKLYEIDVKTSAASAAFDLTNGLSYRYTEVYKDRKGREHESAESGALDIDSDLSGLNGIVIEGFPSTPANSFTQFYALYRTLDEVGYGFPNMYQIAEIPVGQTSYIDVGDTSFTDVLAQGKQIPHLRVLYAGGESIAVGTNNPPPAGAVQALPYQGSMVYVGDDEQRIYYSIPASISPIAFEVVPSIYYLEFVTPYNDVVRSIMTANSGKSLIVYFDRYSMLVNFLPQATDPGVFDQRVTETVSNTRGAAGVHATTELTISESRTIAAAVDGIGLWVTDGVSTVQDWSEELDWAAVIKGVDLTRVELVDNAEMYRLEMLYEQGGVRKELHFFYSRMKQGGRPLVTGPHTMGVRTKHYSNINGTWVGWSGDADRQGRVFVEREHAADDAYGNDEQKPVVPFRVQTGDNYLFGLGTSGIVKQGYPKFGKGGQKDVTVVSTFRRDGAAEPAIKSKQYTVNKQKKLYWSAYADRHSVTIEDVSETELPSLVGYEIDAREVGEGKD